MTYSKPNTPQEESLAMSTEEQREQRYQETKNQMLEHMVANIQQAAAAWKADQQARKPNQPA